MRREDPRQAAAPAGCDTHRRRRTRAGWGVVRTCRASRAAPDGCCAAARRPTTAGRAAARDVRPGRACRKIAWAAPVTAVALLGNVRRGRANQGPGGAVPGHRQCRWANSAAMYAMMTMALKGTSALWHHSRELKAPNSEPAMKVSWKARLS